MDLSKAPVPVDPVLKIHINLYQHQQKNGQKRNTQKGCIRKTYISEGVPTTICVNLSLNKT